MRIEQDGFIIDSAGGLASSLNEWIETKGLKNLIAALVEGPNGAKSYCLFDEESGRPVYANTSMEAVACHIDMMALAEQD